MNLRRKYALNSKFILLLSMLYITINLTCDVVAYKFYHLGSFLIAGSGVVYPITFFISDSIAEVYGYTVAKKIIWLGFICELIFAVLLEIVIRLPLQTYGKNSEAFVLVLGPMLRFVLSCIVADILGIFLNIYCISKWKLMLRGRFFVLRSILATCVGELAMTFISVFLAFSNYNDISENFMMALTSYLWLILYAGILVWPTWLFTSILKRIEKLDVYDINTNFNPFRLN